MIAIVGCGTLGSRLASRLADEELLLFDHDVVSKENLKTQDFSSDEVGMAKTQALARRLPRANAHTVFIDRTNLDLLIEAEVVCDCTDNMYTRKLLNRWCLQNGVPLIHAAAGKKHGVTASFTGKPCLECVYKGKVPVEDCRGRDIDPALADKLSIKQSLLAKQALQDIIPEELFIIGAEISDASMMGKSCLICEGRPELPDDDFYLTWCVQADCLSAKPIKKMRAHAGNEEIEGVYVDKLPDGEIRFPDSVEVDYAHRILRIISERHRQEPR